MIESPDSRQQVRNGLWFGVAAYTVWGLSPLFWNLNESVAPLSLLFYRTIWSLPILAAAITLQRRWAEVRTSYRPNTAKITTVVAALLLAINWGVFLWAVTNDHVVDASLGYFINPLVSVALGVALLGERLRRLQWVAVGIATAGVAGMTIWLGTVPWIALSLAFSFGFYGLLKKRPETPAPLVSLFGEVAVLAAPAVILLPLLAETDGLSFFADTQTTIFLIGTGFMTTIPLLLFGAAAKRIRLSTLGLLQYLAPTLQFLVGIMVFNETLSTATLVGFVVVWIALGVYTYDSIRNRDRDIPIAA
ncbi:MAG: EamA family transporter RarD [Acidimicrobiia bacterium]